MQVPQDIIIRPVISEKSMTLMEKNKYTFIVHSRANKSEIKKAIEDLFNVKVDKVNTIKIRGKKRRQGRYEGYTPERKKAVVTLKPGYKLEIIEGV